MAPGPPNLGDNRFAELATSPKRKKKRQSNKLFESFPLLPNVKIQNPKYIVVSCNEEKKSMKDYSCFAIQRALFLISKDIISISELRDGNLLLLVKDNDTAKKFINSKILLGLCKIECSLHRSLNFTKGTIYAPYLNNIPDEEIVSELSSQSVASVYKFTKLIEGKPVPTGVVLLSFDLYNLPDKIDVSWHSVKVREYIPNPMRCKGCQLLGHTMKRCQNAKACVNCNLPPHTNECSRIYCANCAENHPASSRECKKFIQQKEILTIKTTKKCSMSEAKQIHKTQSLSLNNIHSYSSAIAGKKPPTKTVTNETENTPTISINNESKQNSEASAPQIINSKVQPFNFNIHSQTKLSTQQNKNNNEDHNNQNSPLLNVSSNSLSDGISDIESEESEAIASTSISARRRMSCDDE